MNKRLEALVKEAREIIDSKIVGNKSFSPAECVEALEEILDCAESWVQTLKEEHNLD